MMNRRKGMGNERCGCGGVDDFLQGKMMIFGIDINGDVMDGLQEQDMLRRAQLLN